MYGYAGGLGERTKWPAIGVSEVANDVNALLINFYRVLSSDKLFPKLKRLLEATPFSREFWSDSAEKIAATAGECNWDNPSVEMAAAMFIWNRQSMSGRMANWSPLTKSRTRGGRNADANAWWSAVDGLAEIYDDLRGIVLECQDVLKLIPREDTPQTLFYLDPEYILQGGDTSDIYLRARLFRKPSEEDRQDAKDHHENLLKLLTGGKIKGKVMLSGYRNPLYDTLLKGWTRHEKVIDNKAAKSESKKRVTECLWTNY